MDKKRIKSLLPFAVIAVALVLIIVIIVAIAGTLNAKSDSTKEIGRGLDYLGSLENQSTDKVEETIRNTRTKERMEKIQKGELSVWSMFEDYVILGDSRAVGFYYFGYLEESRVLAEGGATIADIEKNADTLKALNPREIFLCYGLNDVSIGYWNSPEEYVKTFDDELKKLKKLCPKANVYVSSILPATDPAFELSSAWRNIPEYNTAVGEYCKKNNVPYIDNSVICNEHKDMWETDGIHVHKEFYPYWANNMISEVYENEEN